MGCCLPSFLIRFPTLVSILARRATSATSHDVWASCDLAAIVGIISMSSSHPAPLPFLLLLLFFLVPFPLSPACGRAGAGDA